MNKRIRNSFAELLIFTSQAGNGRWVLRFGLWVRPFG